LGSNTIHRVPRSMLLTASSASRRADSERQSGLVAPGPASVHARGASRPARRTVCTVLTPATASRARCSSSTAQASLSPGRTIASSAQAAAQTGQCSEARASAPQTEPEGAKASNRPRSLS
jgi:hypothetical protein